MFHSAAMDQPACQPGPGKVVQALTRISNTGSARSSGGGFHRYPPEIASKYCVTILCDATTVSYLEGNRLHLTGADGG